MNLALTVGFEWTWMDTHSVLIAVLCATACALVGNFLVLRRMSMMGDAISHAVLPGLVAAFLLTGSRESVVMLIGAGVVGVLTAYFTEWIRSAGRVDEGASMGVVFTILFALGLVLIRRYADKVDLDPDCVLYGSIETASTNTIELWGLPLPRAALLLGAVLLLNLVCVALFYKELKISAFDPALATTLGISARWMHYLLMTLVAITTVASFESVGSVLVIAMLIVPPAAAHLLTDRLGFMILLSLGLAALSAGGGYVAALAVPPMIGFPGQAANVAGMMAVTAGALFTAALFLGPRHGLLVRAARRFALALQIAREDALGLLYRLDEQGAKTGEKSLQRSLRHGVGAGPLTARLALASLRRSGLTRRSGGELRLTPAGRAAAQTLLRSHRLWETYLDRNLDVPTDHLHGPAERLEHVTSQGMQSRLAAAVGDPATDPQGRAIPPTPGTDAPTAR